MYIEISKNILLICLTIGFLYLFFNQKNSIEKFTDTSLTESITNLSNISNEIMANGTLTIPANEVDFNGNAHFQSGNTVTIDGTLNVANLNILPRFCIIAFHGNNPPNGWVICDGNNGTPDLRGRFVLAAGHKNGQTDRDWGNYGGEETHTLTTDEMPHHNHNYFDRYYIENKDSVNNQGLSVSNQYGSSGTDSDNNRMLKIDGGTSNTGNSRPHNNMPPFYVLTYIMKT